VYDCFSVLGWAFLISCFFIGKKINTEGQPMGDGKLRRAAGWGVLLLTLLLTACAEGMGYEPAQGIVRSAYPVDPTFKEFYQTLGGEELLGPAISALEIREKLQCQFTERALMCFNPAVTDASRFGLYPLGRELGIQEEAHMAGIAPLDGARIVDGFAIYEKFLPLYDRLYGARYVGSPLTEMRINQDLHRAEQFFENVGFYQNLGDPNGPVFLIPYGAYLCGGNCSYHLKEYWSIVKSNLTEQPFAGSLARLGGPAVFGSLLLKPQIAEDGNLQQVYANAIFYSPPDDPSQVRLRSLPTMLGYPVQPLVEPKIHEQLVFYEVENGLGHNVPRPFDAFVAMHGGRDLSGNPTSEVVLVPGKNLYQQCFENYCLIYDPAASDMLKVRMAPLGKEYFDRFPAPENVQIRNLFSSETINLLVSADRPNLNDNEEQYIRVLVQQRESGQPMERVEATLVLSFPDRPAVRAFFPPTDSSGMTVLIVAPQLNLANGSRVSYQICLNLPSERPLCAQDSYLIWNVQQ